MENIQTTPNQNIPAIPMSTSEEQLRNFKCTVPTCGRSVMDSFDQDPKTYKCASCLMKELEALKAQKPEAYKLEILVDADLTSVVEARNHAMFFAKEKLQEFQGEDNNKAWELFFAWQEQVYQECCALKVTKGVKDKSAKIDFEAWKKQKERQAKEEKEGKQSKKASANGKSDATQKPSSKKDKAKAFMAELGITPDAMMAHFANFCMIHSKPKGQCGCK